MIERAAGIALLLLCLRPGLARGEEAPSASLSDAEHAALVATDR